MLRIENIKLVTGGSRLDADAADSNEMRRQMIDAK